MLEGAVVSSAASALRGMGAAEGCAMPQLPTAGALVGRGQSGLEGSDDGGAPLVEEGSGSGK